MKLILLDGHFIAIGRDDHERVDGFRERDQSIDGAQGVCFQCPSCAIGKEHVEKDGVGYVRGAHYVRIWFANPRGVAVAPAGALPKPRWTASGDTLETLTLTPSINCVSPGDVGGCQWHGWVTKGDAQ